VVLKLVYSYSRLESYENCPLKYKLQYVDRIRTGRKSIEAFMGTLVHATLEKLYRDLRMSRLPSLDELSDYYLSRWEAAYGDDVFVVRDEYGPEDYRQTGLRCIQDYYRRYEPFTGGVAVWLEKKVDIPIRDRRGETVSFTGILDRLDSMEGGRYEIHDYKTSGFLPTADDLQADRQLSLYQLAVETAFPDAREIDLVWHYLVFDRELRLRRERSDLERVAAEMADLVREIEEAADFPPRESQLCEWCEVQEFCPKRKHIYMVAKMPERELGTERGIQLVDQYAQWSERKKEAEEHIKRLREEVLEFASYHNVENLQGSSHILGISRSRLPKVPKPGSAERDELEKLLREGGLWEDVSSLNARTLAAMIQEGCVDRDLADRIEPFIAWEESHTLRIKDLD
jgi:putative RecB family exonuclease